MTKEHTIILASSSPRRAELLRQLGFSFKTFSPDIDESKIETESITEYVLRIAKEKAQKSLRHFHDNNIIICADTCIEYKTKLIGKPRSFEDAKEIYNQLSGNTHYVHTAYAITNSHQLVTNIVTTSVTMRYITESEMQSYWNTKEPWDKAGGYAIQGIGAQFVTSLSGSYSAVMGLPLFELSQDLKHFSIFSL